MEWKRNGLRFFNKRHLFCSISIFFFSISALFCSTTSFTTTCPDNSCLLSAKANLMSSARRYLGGLGSSPPRCLRKCGTCTPCNPVHVPVPPGTPVTAEYYPEA